MSNLVRTLLGRSLQLALPLVTRSRSHFSRHESFSTTSPCPNSGPLSGVKILDLTRVLAGPFCTQILADYGADVVKVEHPRGGDDTRLWREVGEDKIWKSRAPGTSIYFNTVNRNKRSISVNLKNEKGREIILQLAHEADVVVENFIPGKLDRLGLGYQALKAANPSIILASISGYGADGPYATRAGYDVVGAAEGGLLHVTGEADGPPTKPGVGLVDMCTGLYLHGAIVSALLARQKTGVGQKLDTSLFEATVSILANVGMSWVNLEKEARRWGTAHPAIVPYEAFRTKDGSLVIGAVNDRQFQNLCQLLGDRDLATDPRYVDNSARVLNRKELKQALDTLFMKKTTGEWETVLEGSGMPYGPINTLENVFSHPQALARHMVETVEQGAAVAGTIKVLGIPVKFSETKPSIRGGPPSLGQHTNLILRELGYSSSAIADLRNNGAI